VSSLWAVVRELKNRAPIADPDVSFLDESMIVPHISRGPIDDLLAGLGKDDEGEHSNDGGDNE
ncbi:hypothetical protein HAX54_039708, partial [Datura stramonium]|nr:hypothetical protein [Datura stramonium]